MYAASMCKLYIMRGYIRECTLMEMIASGGKIWDGMVTRWGGETNTNFTNRKKSVKRKREGNKKGRIG